MLQFTRGENNPKQPKINVYTTHRVWYYRSMEDDKIKEKFLADVQALALRYGITRLKVESRNFVRDYKAKDGVNLTLISEKAVVRALGKVSKIPIGEDQEHKTFEDAEKFARNHWSEYFKKRRSRWTPAEIAGEKRRQKRYRDARRLREKRVSTNQ